MFVFIVNPASGNGKSLAVWLKIEKNLQEQQIPYKVIISISEVAASEFIHTIQQSNHIKAVAVIGGDGTTSSIIQVLANTRIPIAIFPSGSGNDTARMFRLTNDPKQFLLGMLDNRTTSIDLLKLNGRFGITVAGTGIDSMIGNRANHSFYKPILSKLGAGSLAYIIAAALSAITFKSFNGSITIDGNKQKLTNAWLIACGNTTSYGGGLTICPQALPTDGILNITMFHELRRIKAIRRIFPTLLRGKPIFKEGITYKEGKEIIIETDRPISAIVDGEITTTTPLHITVHKKALQLLLTT